MNKTWILLLLLSIPAIIYWRGKARDRRIGILVFGRAKYYQDYETCGSFGERPFKGFIFSNEGLKVLKVRYGKDYLSIKVETDSGKIGWVCVGENVYLLDKAKRKR
jgi:hypothetical protein